jgi:AcrR family transcriptional regulator
MADTVKGRRRYESPMREEAALETRRRIRAAAGRLFVEQGFVATTMRQVAEAAGVAERTAYTAFPTKAQLFQEVVGVAIVGDELPVAVADRDEFRASLHAPDPRRALELLVDYSAELLERAGDLIMTAEQSSGADPDMRRFSAEGAAATRSNMATRARALAGRGDLRPGLDERHAADILYALASPYLHHLLRRRCGWSADEYRAWLLDTLVAGLLP